MHIIELWSKSLYISRAVSHFYETEFEIWACWQYWKFLQFSESMLLLQAVFLCFHEQKKWTELLLTARFIIMTLALATNARAYARWRAESVCQNARVSNCQRLTVGSLFDWLLEKRFPISSWLCLPVVRIYCRSCLIFCCCFWMHATYLLRTGAARLTFWGIHNWHLILTLTNKNL